MQFIPAKPDASSIDVTAQPLQLLTLKLSLKSPSLLHPLTILAVKEYPLRQGPLRHLPRLPPRPNSGVQIRPQRRKLRDLAPQRLLPQNPQHLCPQPVKDLLRAPGPEVAEGAEYGLDAGLIRVGGSGCSGVGADGAGAGESAAGNELLAVLCKEVLRDVCFLN